MERRTRTRGGPGRVADAPRVARGFDAPVSPPPAGVRARHTFAALAPPPAVVAPAGPVLQARSDDESDRARVLRPSGQGRPLPEPVRSRMESSLGADFSSVRVHEGREAASIGAIAYTRGADIHFAPGQYRPGSAGGQRLLGHELTHVVQQAQGRVRAPTGGGIPINDSPALEREADVLGARAARSTRQDED